ncbi:hypothetical protein ANN_22319 [Periplaneta americana]|uniref:Transposase Tc1-like domain-containing protein n=1 Tax=Periplaneta americana TaxID=6978 RepID=A0ABQ8S7U0_PERAM|nr:hypothetical protein ANN_22319 [Periplaneta americana]
MWDPRTGDRHRGRPRKRWADFYTTQAVVSVLHPTILRAYQISALSRTSLPVMWIIYGSGRQHSLKWVKGNWSRPVCPVVQQEEVESMPASSYECTMVQCVLHGALREKTSSAKMLRNALQNVGNVVVSTQTVTNRLHERDLNARRLLRCPAIRRGNREARALWCQQHGDWADDQWSLVSLATNHALAYIHILEHGCPNTVKREESGLTPSYSLQENDMFMHVLCFKTSN